MADPEGGLEYYIKFPSSGFNYAQNGESDYVFVVDEEKIPVILLFGWAGCQDKYLAKYSKIYEEKGLITLRYIAPVKCLFWNRACMISIGEKLVRLLLDLNFETHPVIVHCFSNGGAFIYQNFELALRNSPKPIKVKGVIFDSAPGKRRVHTLYRAISAIVGGSVLYNLAVSLMVTALCTVMWLTDIFNDMIHPKNTVVSDPFSKLWDEKNRYPQHFIYSTGDNLVPYHDVEKFAAHRRAKGIDVTTYRLEGTPHVKHYSHDREGYMASVYNFVNKCLNGKH